MQNRLADIPETLLMGPGPSSVLPEVYRALARPTLGHLDPDFIALMDETKDLLRQVMQTQNAVTFPLSGTGSAGMEAAFANLVEPGDRVLILVNGYFSQRMTDMAARLGGVVDKIEFDWGTPIVPDEPEATTHHLGETWRTAALAAGAIALGVAGAFLGGRRR